MMKAAALFGRKRAPRPFKEYYAEWINTLKDSLLPLLRRSIAESPPSVLAGAVARFHRHFLSYYAALDAAASNDVAQLLFPEWRNALEKPFLWLGDLHPYLLTNLLRSFLETHSDSDSDSGSDAAGSPSFNLNFNCKCGYNYKTLIEISRSTQFSDRSWQVATAWRNPARSLVQRVEEVDLGLRLLVPAVTARARDAQTGLVAKLGTSWVELEEGKKEAAIGEAIEDHIEEMVSVFVHANRLRSSVLSEMVSVMDVYQAALFFDGLAQFLVGFKDPELVCEFERCRVHLS